MHHSISSVRMKQKSAVIALTIGLWNRRKKRNIWRGRKSSATGMYAGLCAWKLIRFMSAMRWIYRQSGNVDAPMMTITHVLNRKNSFILPLGSIWSYYGIKLLLERLTKQQINGIEIMNKKKYCLVRVRKETHRNSQYIHNATGKYHKKQNESNWPRLSISAVCHRIEWPKVCLAECIPMSIHCKHFWGFWKQKKRDVKKRPRVFSFNVDA